MIRFAIHGAMGRMGQTVAKLTETFAQFHLEKVFERSDHPDLGKDYFSILKIKKEYEIPIETISQEKLVSLQGIIDFSSPTACVNLIKLCAQKGIPVVTGTTGLSESDFGEIREASQKIPIVQSANMSLGVNLLFALTQKAAQVLKNQGFDAEVVEIHHSKKKDAPSGTAKTLEKILSEEMQIPAHLIIYGRQGVTGERQRELGVFAIRGGDVVGEHTVYFFGHGERLELKHLATSREIFARGAFIALAFLQDKKSGLYSMLDVLGLS